MKTHTELLKQALGALEKSDGFLYNWHENATDDEADAYSTARQLNEKAIIAINEHLAAPVRPTEPGWYVVLAPDFDKPTVRAFGKDGRWWIPLGRGNGEDGWMSGREYKNWLGPIAPIDDEQPFLSSPLTDEERHQINASNQHQERDE